MTGDPHEFAQRAAAVRTAGERAAGPDPSGVPGRCGHQAPAFMNQPPQLCALAHGHPGWHKGDDGSEWNDPSGVPVDAVPAAEMAELDDEPSVFYKETSRGTFKVARAMTLEEQAERSRRLNAQRESVPAERPGCFDVYECETRGCYAGSVGVLRCEGAAVLAQRESVPTEGGGLDTAALRGHHDECDGDRCDHFDGTDGRCDVWRMADEIDRLRAEIDERWAEPSWTDSQIRQAFHAYGLGRRDAAGLWHSTNGLLSALLRDVHCPAAPAPAPPAECCCEPGTARVCVAAVHRHTAPAQDGPGELQPISNPELKLKLDGPE